MLPLAAAPAPHPTLAPSPGAHHQREEADGKLAVHHPLLGLAVGVARVVDEPPKVALCQGVDKGTHPAGQLAGGRRQRTGDQARSLCLISSTQHGGSTAGKQRTIGRAICICRGAAGGPQQPALTRRDASITSPLPTFMK